MRLIGIIVCTGMMIHTFFISGDMYEIMLWPIPFLWTFGLSVLPATVYIVTASGEYRFRKNEAVSFDKERFTYGYRDSRTGFSNQFFLFKVLYKDITEIKFDEETGVLEIWGNNIVAETYENSELKESLSGKGLSLLDAYDIEAAQRLRELTGINR